MGWGDAHGHFNYLPVVDSDEADGAITHVRFSPNGTTAPHVDGAADPSFTITFEVIVE